MACSRPGQRTVRSTLTDDLGQPIAAFNFTEGARPKCGDTDRDIYRIFMTGWTEPPCRHLQTTSNRTRRGTWCSICARSCHTTLSSKEKQMAKQLGLKPVDPNAPRDNSRSGNAGSNEVDFSIQGEILSMKYDRYRGLALLAVTVVLTCVAAFWVGKCQCGRRGQDYRHRQARRHLLPT
jgi:hypothetical protein